MNRNFFIEVNSQQRNFDLERISGDVFLYRYIKEEDRVIAVLSDGMGQKQISLQPLRQQWP
jgi:hypothetical protein